MRQQPVPDQTGKIVNRLTVIGIAHRPKGAMPRGVFYECLCECGNRTVVQGSRLHRNIAKSCGCAKGPAKDAHRQYVSQKFDPDDIHKPIPLSLTREQARKSYGVCDAFFRLF